MELDSFSMVLFIKIESSCHINFLQFTFIKHGTQALPTKLLFSNFHHISCPAVARWGKECGGAREEGAKEIFSELRHPLENCSPLVAMCSMKCVEFYFNTFKALS